MKMQCCLLIFFVLVCRTYTIRIREYKNCVLRTVIKSNVLIKICCMYLLSKMQFSKHHIWHNHDQLLLNELMTFFFNLNCHFYFTIHILPQLFSNDKKIQGFFCSCRCFCFLHIKYSTCTSALVR